MKWIKDDFIISDDRSLIDLDAVLQLLSKTYWAFDRTIETIQKGVEHSISFGIYHHGQQIGFARVVTDKAVFSWLLDVVIAEIYRGNGLGQWLIQCILDHPDIKHTRVALATKDAHDFYKKFKFKESQCMSRAVNTGNQ